MTNEQAVRIIKGERGWESNDRIIKAFDCAIQAIEEIQQYRELEQRLQSVYGEHDGLLEIIVNGLVKYENAPDKAVKCVLLTDEDVDKWNEYRTIGTVEELKELKENGVFSGVELAMIATNLMTLEQYQSIGTVEECREAVERMKPKKPNKIFSDFYPIVHYYCPKCGRRFGERGIHNVILFNQEKYCQGEECGQAIDWSE